MLNKPCASAAVRNTTAILDVLRYEFRNADSVLEIGSGTGQHAVAFAEALGHLNWQTSDVDANHPGIQAWLDDANLKNVQAPLSLDVMSADVTPRTYAAVFSANTAHIMSWPAVERMFLLVTTVLDRNGVFCLYGPFRENGEFSTLSNANFHRSLEMQNPLMGIRHLEELDELASKGNMRRLRRYAMPANNLLVVWQKESADE